MCHVDRNVLGSRACSRAFYAMVGASLLFLPIRVRIAQHATLQLFPDALGWMIVAVVLAWIRGLHPDVARLRRIAIGGVILSLPQLLSFHTDVQSWRSGYGVLYGMSVLVLVIFVWQLCGLIARLADEAKRPDIRRTAISRRRSFALVFLLPAFGIAMAGVDSPSLVAVIAAGALFVLAACLITMLMALLASTGRMCAAAAQDASDPVENALPADDASQWP